MKAFLDIETGGFSITKNGVCEIALVAVNDSGIVDCFHKLITPYTRDPDTNELVSYKEDSMKINGLTELQLIETGVDVVKVCETLLQFIEKYQITTIIGHCSKKFDYPRVKYLIERFTREVFDIDQEDTHDIAKSKLNLPSYKLIDLCAHFGIENEKEHSALGDAKATYELYKKLI